MHLICRLLRLNADSRDGQITAASVMSILLNLLIAVVKVIMGILTKSIAIVSEGINNASDMVTSVLTLIGTRLAGKHPDEKHPFGYGRIEYLTSLVLGILITVTGVETLTSSVDRIFHPAELSISVLSLVIVALSAVSKFLLGTYVIGIGKKTGSSALTAVGVDSRNDSFVSAVTILSAVVFLTAHISVDAYAGIFTSLLILKAGIETLAGTISELLGRPGEKELAETLYREIRNTEGVLNAADMMLHNYGPEAYSGSVNIEIDHDKSVGEIYAVIHDLQLRIMEKYNVTMVFGIYAVDYDHVESRRLRKAISDFVQSHEHVKSYHALYTAPDSDKFYCDLVVDYALSDWDALREEFTAYIKNILSDKTLVLTIETEFV